MAKGEMNIEECKDYVRNFLKNNSKNSEPKEQLNWLKTYNFYALAKEESKNKHVEEDFTELAKAIYFILWHKSEDNEYSLPMLTSWENMEDYYGGETINTFNTLFQSEFVGIQKFVPVTEENAKFYLNVIKFRINYLTIGNFMLLPKLLCNNSSLNTLKGFNSKYRDYADLFFYDLFETTNLKDLKEVNDFYFKKIGSKEFCEKNFLEPYFGNGKFKIVFGVNEEKTQYPNYPYFYWNTRVIDKNEYKEFAKDYIAKANNIIEYRANKICEILEKELFSNK